MSGCTVPPAGWRCTRAAGHDGPCAALPDSQSLPDHSAPALTWGGWIEDSHQRRWVAMEDADAVVDRLKAEVEALKAERDRAVETRENANTVSVRAEGENRALREAIKSHQFAIEHAGTVHVADEESATRAEHKNAADERLWRSVESDEVSR